MIYGLFKKKEKKMRKYKIHILAPLSGQGCDNWDASCTLFASCWWDCEV